MENENINTNATDTQMNSTNESKSESFANEALTATTNYGTISASDIENGAAELVLMPQIEESTGEDASGAESTLPVFDAEAASIGINSFYDGCITVAGAKVYYKFEVPVSGRYTVHSRGDLDTYGVLYDSSGVPLDCDDNSPVRSKNFRITRTLQCGITYYLSVTANNGETGCFSIRLTDKVFATTVAIQPAIVSMKVGETICISDMTTVYPPEVENKNVNYTCYDTNVVRLAQNMEPDSNGHLKNVATITALSPGVAIVRGHDFNNEAEIGVCKITVKDYCGGTNYKDVTKHNLVLQNDGYYVCSECGYRVISPELQDKDILSEEDYFKVLGCIASRSYYERIKMERSNLCIEGLNYIIDNIRSKDEYSSKYEYVGSDGKYPIIYPDAVLVELFADRFEIDPIFTSSLFDNNVFSVAYDEVDDLNIAKYNGYLDLVKDVVDIATKIALDGEQEAPNIAFYIVPTEYEHLFLTITLEDVCSVIVTILSGLAIAAGYPELALILELILVGAANNTNEKIELGDRVITISIPSSLDTENYMYQCEKVQLFFSPNGELRGSIAEITPEEYIALGV